MQKFVFILFVYSMMFAHATTDDLGEYLSSELNTFEQNEEYCVDEFNKSMKELLQDDSNDLISKAFSLASLKLSYRQLSEGVEKQTLEQYIRGKVQELNLADNQEFLQRVQELYERNGESKDLTEINEIVTGLNDKNYFPKAERLSNKEGSVFMLALSMYDECNDLALCIDKSDAAVTWFMGELHERAQENDIGSSQSNLMGLSVRIAHTSGVFNSTIPHTPEELSEDIIDLEHDVKTAIHNHKQAFLEDYEMCRVIIEDSRCLQKTFNEGFDNSLASIVRDLKRQNASDISSENLRLTFANQVTVNLNNALKVKRPPREPQLPPLGPLESLGVNLQGNDQEGPEMCGGEPFASEVESIHAFGIDFSRIGYLANGRNSTGAHKVKSFKPNRLKKILDPFEKGISGPGFRVTAFMKTFVMNLKYGRASVCCEDAVDWRPKMGLSLSMYGGVEAKFGYNVGFLSYDLAGIGILVGLGISMGGGITTPPNGCEEVDLCGTARISPTVYGGGYVDALDGWIGGELKIAWRPYVVGRLCKSDMVTSEKFANIKGDYKVGSIWLQGTFQIGWLTTYNYYKPVYTNDADNSFAFDVFP